MEIFETTNPVEAVIYATECLKPNGHEGVVVLFNKSILLQTGIIDTSNKNAAKDLGIPVWETKHMDGSTVCFEGDLSLCMTSEGENDFGDCLFEATINFLISKGINAANVGNDILANEKKVMSWSCGVMETGWVQTVAHFSVNIDLELITHLCTKPIEKIPGALSEYGIAAEELYDEVVKPLLDKYR